MNSMVFMDSWLILLAFLVYLHKNQVPQILMNSGLFMNRTHKQRMLFINRTRILPFPAARPAYADRFKGGYAWLFQGGYLRLFMLCVVI